MCQFRGSVILQAYSLALFTEIIEPVITHFGDSEAVIENKL